jgi:uncharacterized protein (DUF433 family)
MTWHDELIEIVDGVPTVRGAGVPVARIKQVWAEKGVYAQQLRDAFPGLSDLQLGAAVSWSGELPLLASYSAANPPSLAASIWRDAERWTLEVVGGDSVAFHRWEIEGRELLLHLEERGLADLQWFDEAHPESPRVDIRSVLTRRD